MNTARTTLPAEIPNMCPDCSARAILTQTEPGVYALVIAHAVSCPAYRSIVAKRGGA